MTRMYATRQSSALAEFRALQHEPHHVIMLGRPEMPLLEPPAVDDVADEIERLAIDMVEEIDQHRGVATARAEVVVADPHRAITPPLADHALGHQRVGGDRKSGV